MSCQRSERGGFESDTAAAAGGATRSGAFDGDLEARGGGAATVDFGAGFGDVDAEAAFGGLDTAGGGAFVDSVGATLGVTAAIAGASRGAAGAMAPTSCPGVSVAVLPGRAGGAGREGSADLVAGGVVVSASIHKAPNVVATW